MKQKIIFLFTGESRSSPFSHNFNKKRNNKSSLEILYSYNHYIFTKEFKDRFDYKIFISTDDIHLENTNKYFNVNLENIHLLNTKYYKKSCNEIPNISHYLNIYNKRDFKKCKKFEGSIHQHYKILDCYNMYRCSEHYNSADYIIRLRMDIAINVDLCYLIDYLNKWKNIEIFLRWDIFAIGKKDIMNCYCCGLENNYGNYNFNVNVPKKVPLMLDYHEVDRKNWTYTAERQLFEMLFEYCNKKNLNINTAIFAPYCKKGLDSFKNIIGIKR